MGAHAAQLRAAVAPRRAAARGRAVRRAPRRHHAHPARCTRRAISRRPRSRRASLERLVARGLGRGVLDALEREQAPLFTTFFATALAADRRSARRGRLPRDRHRPRARLGAARSARGAASATSRRPSAPCAASPPTASRPSASSSRAFRCPTSCWAARSSSSRKRHLARRLGRLDPRGRFRERARRRGRAARLGGSLDADGESPLLVFAVGGAGAQAAPRAPFLPSLRPLIEARPAAPRAARRHAARRARGLRGARRAPRSRRSPGRARRGRVRPRRLLPRLQRAARRGRRPVDEAQRDDVLRGARAAARARRRPSGAQEVYNRRWAVENGAGASRSASRAFAGEWLAEWLADGTLAGAAWNGFTRLPKRGLLSDPAARSSESRRRLGTKHAPPQHRQAVRSPLDRPVREAVEPGARGQQVLEGRPGQRPERERAPAQRRVPRRRRARCARRAHASQAARVVAPGRDERARASRAACGLSSRRPQ